MAIWEEAIGAFIGLIVLAAIFTPLERKWPADKRKFLRLGWKTDVLHVLLTGFLDRVFQLIGIVAAFLLVGWWAPEPIGAAIRAQPIALQYIEAFLLANVLGYWTHRLSHTVPLLWRFHKVHHSSKKLDWLAGARRHPLEQTWSGLFIGIPLLFLGFTLIQVAVIDIVLGLWGVFLHANTRLEIRWLRKFIAMPVYHHWHHSDDPVRYNTNYSLFPWVDAMFGTRYMEETRPTGYGVKGYTPGGYLRQMAAPFVKQKLEWIEVETDGES